MWKDSCSNMETPVTPPSRKWLGIIKPCKATTAQRIPVNVKKSDFGEKTTTQLIFVSFSTLILIYFFTGKTPENHLFTTEYAVAIFVLDH